MTTHNRKQIADELERMALERAESAREYEILYAAASELREEGGEPSEQAMRWGETLDDVRRRAPDLAAQPAKTDEPTLEDWIAHKAACVLCADDDPVDGSVCEEWRPILIKWGMADPASVDASTKTDEPTCSVCGNENRYGGLSHVQAYAHQFVAAQPVDSDEFVEAVYDILCNYRTQTREDCRAVAYKIAELPERTPEPSESDVELVKAMISATAKFQNALHEGRYDNVLLAGMHEARAKLLARLSERRQGVTLARKWLEELDAELSTSFASASTHFKSGWATAMDRIEEKIAAAESGLAERGSAQ